MRKIPHKEEFDPKVEVDGFGTPKNAFSLAHFALPKLVPMRGCGENDGLDLF